LGSSSVSQILQIVLQGPAVAHDTAWDWAAKLTGLRNSRNRRTQQGRDEDGLECNLGSHVSHPPVLRSHDTLSTADKAVCAKTEEMLRQKSPARRGNQQAAPARLAGGHDDALHHTSADGVF
jgi:hypothetical protein